MESTRDGVSLSLSPRTEDRGSGIGIDEDVVTRSRLARGDPVDADSSQLPDVSKRTEEERSDILETHTECIVP